MVFISINPLLLNLLSFMSNPAVFRPVGVLILYCFFCIVLHIVMLNCICTALSLAVWCIVIGPVCVFATDGRAGIVGLLPQ